MTTMLRRGDEGYRRLIEVLVGARDEDDEDSPPRSHSVASMESTLFASGSPCLA